MSESQDEFDPPFEAIEPAHCRGPVLFNSPHSGRVYPRAFLLASRLDLATLRRSEDSFVDDLIAGLVGRGHPIMRLERDDKANETTWAAFPQFYWRHPVARASCSGNSRHIDTDPNPSCSMTRSPRPAAAGCTKPYSIRRPSMLSCSVCMPRAA